jgi:hypothetical protein
LIWCSCCRKVQVLWLNFHKQVSVQESRSHLCCFTNKTVLIAKCTKYDSLTSLLHLQAAAHIHIP